MKGFINCELPSLDKDYNNAAGEVILAEGICISLLNLQLIFEVIIHNYRFYSKKYQAITPIVARLMYHEKQDRIFVSKRDLFKDVPTNISPDEFEQAHKYFIFTDVKEKVPEIAAPQIAQAPAESVFFMLHNL